MRGAAYRMISRIRSRASPRWQWVVQSWQLPSWPWGHMAVRASVASTVSRHEGQSPQGSFLPEWCALQNMRPIASRTLRSFSVRLLSMFSIISIECMIRKTAIMYVVTTTYICEWEDHGTKRVPCSNAAVQRIETGTNRSDARMSRSTRTPLRRRRAHPSDG